MKARIKHFPKHANHLKTAQYATEKHQLMGFILHTASTRVLKVSFLSHCAQVVVHCTISTARSLILIFKKDTITESSANLRIWCLEYWYSFVFRANERAKGMQLTFTHCHVSGKSPPRFEGRIRTADAPQPYCWNMWLNTIKSWREINENKAYKQS